MYLRLRALCLLTMLLASAVPARAQVVYSTDFESSLAGAEWSARTTSLTPRGARRFLGRFGEETVQLTLVNLPAHSAMTVNFDLFVIQSWDGNDPTFGPDVWTLSIPGERTILQTSFNNVPAGTQAYPGSFPAANVGGTTGSSERGTLGYPAISGFNGFNDVVYRMRFVFPHSGSSVALAFAGALNEIFSNESWGIDNVSIEVSNPPGGVIEPSLPAVYVPEGATDVLVPFRRVGGTNVPATVSYSTVIGTATEVDYVATNGTVQFARGSTETQVPISLIDDTIADGRDEAFALVTATPDPDVALSTARPVVWIFDNENIDPDFARLDLSPIASEGGASLTSAWGDFDGDGPVDLFVGNIGQQRNFLYRNTGAGTFQKITSGIVPNDIGETIGASWADYDNDGDLDLITAKYSTSVLYRNGGTIGFTRVNLPGTTANGSAWGDYDNDGNLDLLITTETGGNLLFRNNGAGGLTRVTTGPVVTDVATSVCAAWADYDNDGRLDLFVGNAGGTPNFLYRNTGNGSFARVTTGAITTDSGQCYACAWGDYDNDGFLDLYVSNFGGGGFLYRNNRDGTFTKVTGIISTSENSLGCIWNDLDNDGDLDLLVANFGAISSIYLNNGNGSFAKRTGFLMTRDLNPAVAVASADYDDDGDVDIFVGRYRQLNNSLYVNQGGTNNFLKVNLRGTLSNRSAIGARVRLTTAAAGSDRTQLREISAGNSVAQSELTAHFGVGAASSAQLSILWPSGAVQSWTNLPVNQRLRIVEAPQLTAAIPPGTMRVSAATNATVLIESSTNLTTWSSVLSTNSQGGDFTITAPVEEKDAYRFYRAMYEVR